MRPLQLVNKAVRATKSQKHEIAPKAVHILYDFCALWCIVLLLREGGFSDQAQIEIGNIISKKYHHEPI